VSDQRTTYLLPCTCGRAVRVEPRQAGGSVPCECGRTCPVPTLREIQRLRPAPTSEEERSDIRAGENSGWGNPQRFLVAGAFLCVLAAIAAVIIYRQLPTRQIAGPEQVRAYLLKLPTQETRRFFHERLLPGIDLRDAPEIESAHNKAYLGLGALGAVGAIGAILVAIGCSRMVRRR
jgi:hypothetical protein